MKPRDWRRETQDEYFWAQEQMETRRIVRQFVYVAEKVGYTLDDLCEMLTTQNVPVKELTGLVFYKARERRGELGL